VTILLCRISKWETLMMDQSFSDFLQHHAPIFLNDQPVFYTVKSSMSANTSLMTWK
jgi:hypothetical protein